MLLEGIFPALTTCFHPDGRLHWRKLEQNIERYSRTAVSGLVLLGSTGEAILLGDEESREVLRVARGAAAPEKVLVAGVGRESVLETLRLAEYAATLSYDAVLVRTPYFYRPQMQDREMLTFYQTVADRSPLPVLLYSVPAYTGYELPLGVIAELALHPNIIGMKDSGGSVERIARIVAVTRTAGKRAVAVTPVFAAVTARMSASRPEAVCPDAAGLDPVQAAAGQPLPAARTRVKQVGFQLLAGAARILCPSLEVGATGGVSALADFLPQAVQEIYTAWKDNDAALAQQKQHRIVSAELEICVRLGIPGVKHALDLNGYYGGRPRMPFLPLTAEEQQKIQALLSGLPG